MDPVRLDVAFKGPVYYGAELLMKSAAVDHGHRFDVYAGSGEKPAMPGRIVTGESACHSLGSIAPARVAG